MNDEELARAVQRDGFAFLRSAELQELLGLQHRRPDDWEQFTSSWDDLPRDDYMADGGRYRRRRHAVLRTSPGAATPVLQPPEPHYQALDYNPLNGGIARVYQPIAAEVVEGHSMRALLGFASALFGRLRPGVVAWKIELHQFRIEASSEEQGLPTPEGSHRDGVDCVLVVLVRRVNIESGTTTVYDLHRRPLGSFTLTEPLDAAIVDDARVLHGVTPVLPQGPSQRAFRDVLVATFLRSPAPEPGGSPTVA